MSTAEEIYEQVKTLPEPLIKEILDFVEFMSRKTAIPLKGLTAEAPAASHWPKIVLDYSGEPDFPPFEAARSQLTTPVEDPLA
jgi:hypothetical protein